jgi:hypothetical protein
MDSSAVRKTLLILAVALTLATTVPAAPNSDFQAAELLSITSRKGLDNVATHRWAIFTVQIGDVIYTGSGKRIKHPTDDFQEGLNAGDAIHAAIKGDEMTLRKPDGGQVKTKIIKRAPAQ